MTKLKPIFLYFVFTFLCLFIVGPSVIIPWWVGSDAPVFDREFFPVSDAEHLVILEKASRLEQDGKLDDALAEYKEALKAESESVRWEANKGAARVGHKLRLPFSSWNELDLVRELSIKARLPIVAALLLYGLYRLAAWVARLTLRPGWTIRPFPVFASVDASAGAAFTQMLMDDLAIIQWFYQRPSAELDRIGAKVTLENFVPEQGGDNPWAEVLGSLREAQGKNAQVFFLEQAVRVMSSLRRKRRYVLSGSVELFPREARALAQLTDARKGAVLIHLNASSQEADSLEISLTPASSAPPSMSSESARVMSIEISRLQVSLIDAKDDQQLLSDAAHVLAYKLWYALSEGARVEFQPDSWKTVYYFVRALRALRRNQLDPMETAAAEEALTCLRILGDLDPLYRPGHFFLGFTYLTAGYAHKAQHEFEQLMGPVEKAADAYLPLNAAPDDPRGCRGGGDMASVHVERLDHLGLVACMIQDVGLIRMIDARLMPDAPEAITPGEAVAGMSLKGLGVANRPLSLTPQFFTHTPLDLLCRPGGRAARFNRLKRGRTLDAVQA